MAIHLKKLKTLCIVEHVRHNTEWNIKTWSQTNI